MNIRIINSPSKGTLDMIRRRSAEKFRYENPGAVGLIQGRFIDMVYFSDICEKSSNVQVLDLRGNCPQAMLLLAVIGDTGEVEEAIQKVVEMDKGDRQ